MFVMFLNVIFHVWVVIKIQPFMKEISLQLLNSALSAIQERSLGAQCLLDQPLGNESHKCVSVVHPNTWQGCVWYTCTDVGRLECSPDP